MKELAILLLTGVIVISLLVWFIVNMKQPIKSEKFIPIKRNIHISIIE